MLECKFSLYNIHILFTFLLTGYFSAFYIFIFGLIWFVNKVVDFFLSKSVDKFAYHDCYFHFQCQQKPIFVVQLHGFVVPFKFLLLSSLNKKLTNQFFYLVLDFLSS